MSYSFALQIVNGYIHDKFKNNRPPSEHFITNFLAVAVNCMIKCIANNQCHFKFLFSMMDKERIRNLNWCQYVFDSLIKSHVDWRKQNGKGFYKGPLQFLMVIYGFIKCSFIICKNDHSFYDYVHLYFHWCSFSILSCSCFTLIGFKGWTNGLQEHFPLYLLGKKKWFLRGWN